MRLPEFIVGGQSNIFSMGAPRGYIGPRDLIPCEAYGRSGFYLLDKDAWPVTGEYFLDFAKWSKGREAIISWGGNQNITAFLFEPRIRFDFLEERVPGFIDNYDVVIPKSLVKIQQDQHIKPLKGFLESLKDTAARITLLSTQPPRPDLDQFFDGLKRTQVWMDVAAQYNVDLEKTRITPPSLMLKLWMVTEELMREAADACGARYVAVPSDAKDSDGYLHEKYFLHDDFTHPNNDFGQMMLKVALL